MSATYTNKLQSQYEIQLNGKYWDNRYQRTYNVSEIKVNEDNCDAEITCIYSNGSVKKESGNFILYCLDCKQHQVSI